MSMPRLPIMTAGTPIQEAHRPCGTCDASSSAVAPPAAQCISPESCVHFTKTDQLALTPMPRHLCDALYIHQGSVKAPQGLPGSIHPAHPNLPGQPQHTSQ